MHGTRNASHTYQKKHAVGLLLLKITTAITHTVIRVERAWQATESTNTPHCSAAFICCTPARHKQRSVRSTLANSKDKALAPHARIALQHTKFVATCMWAQMLQLALSPMAKNTNAAVAASTLCCNAVTPPMGCSAPSQLASKLMHASRFL